MVVQGIGAEKAQVLLCREDIGVEGAGKAGRLHLLYDWGATVTLVAHAAAEKAGLERRRQPTAAIAGRCTMVDSYYMVQVVDGNDKVRTVKALGVDHIATLAATAVPADIGRRLPQVKGFEEKLARPAGDVEMLDSMDNHGWMYVGSSQVEGDNLRLMQSMLSPRCILMGSARTASPGAGTQGSVADQPRGLRRSDGKRPEPQPMNSLRVIMTMMLFMMEELPSERHSSHTTATTRVHRSSSTRCSTPSCVATWRRYTPSSESSTERSCRSRRSGWCRSPGV
jgi:hypothetical protein